MKICPQCGFLEMAYWRQNRWRTNIEFTKIAEFQINQPEQARDLEKNPYSLDKYYAYRLSGKYRQIVERVLRTEFDSSGMAAFHQPMEHVEHKYSRDPKQQELVTI